MICKECKEKIEFNYYKAVIQIMKQKQLCFNCLFWTEYIELKNKSESVRIKGEHYWIGEEDGPFHFRGFGGKKFKIRFKNSKEITTTNLWYQGEIPDRFRDRLPNNAEFIKE